MADPYFGADEIDPLSVEGGGKPASLPTSTAPSSFWQGYFENGATGGVGRAPVSYSTTNQDQARAWQTQFMQDLQRQAAGDPNSRAQQQLSQGYADARAGQSALGSTMRGTGGAAGLRHGVIGAGSLQRGYAGDQQMLMQQEQQSAQAALAQMLAQQRQQDAAQAQAMAGNAMGNTSLDNAMRQFFESQGLNMGISAAQRGVDVARAQAGIQDARTALNNDLYNQSAQAAGTMAGTASNWFGGGRSNYRQVDGQDSIVPTWDK